MLASGLLFACSVSHVAADLRMASQPNQGNPRGPGGYLLANQGTTPWKIYPWKKQMHYRYFEPSTFNYQGLKNQKARNYDNFLRSNIDNEQDNRNFNTEEGKDHLPFRTLDSEVFPAHVVPNNQNSRRRHSTAIQQAPMEYDLVREMKVNETMLVPLRWNNPHASEMEVNIWIFEHGAGKKPIVVPIRKPSCSAEGHQDNIISFTIPQNFGLLGNKIPGFNGCTKNSKPMCTLQIYSHSVESRTYAIGFPIIIDGHHTELSAKSTQIESATEDPWWDMSKLRELCLPATDPSANIEFATPRWARLVSDVYNHAYQNSDYSPYSGQQHELISKNLQASAINKMEVGNRGELGKSILTQDQTNRLNYLRGLEDKVYKNYEALANKVIKSIEGRVKNSGTIVGTFGSQPLANCFRCAEAGSTNTNRQQTNTYIPSFKLPANYVQQARNLVGSKYAALITESGVVQIYVAAYKDLLPFYYQSRDLGIIYQDPIVKEEIGTMVDTTKFKKVDANGKNDNGVFASIEAKKKFVASRGCPAECMDFKMTSFLQLEDDKTVHDFQPDPSEWSLNHSASLLQENDDTSQAGASSSSSSGQTIKAGQPAGQPGFLEEVFSFPQGNSLQSVAGEKPMMQRKVSQVYYPRTTGYFSGFRIRDHFTVQWTADWTVRRAGRYTFYLTSDDGSKLWIDEAVVVNHDGRHGWSSRSGSQTYSAGSHPLRLQYFDYNGYGGIYFNFAGPDTSNRQYRMSSSYVKTPASGGSSHKLHSHAKVASSWTTQSQAKMATYSRAVTLKYDLGNNMWVVGAMDGSTLKMTQVKIVNETEYHWIAAREWRNPPSYCRQPLGFTAQNCFKGSDPGRDVFTLIPPFVKNKVNIPRGVKGAKPKKGEITLANAMVWYCVARQDKKKVNGPFAKLSEAKKSLNNQTASRTNRQMICEVSKHGPKRDPNWVGGEHQGVGKNAGFNKYWNNFNDIVAMNKLCDEDVACKYKVPEHVVEKPLYKGVKATNVSGSCYQCVQFFGKEVHVLNRPKVPKLSKDIINSGGREPGSVSGMLPNNPNLLQTRASRRRRRTALLQEGQKRKGNKKRQRRRDHRQVRDFLDRLALKQQQDDGLAPGLGMMVLNDVERLPEVIRD